MASTFQTGPSCSLHVCSLHGGKGMCHVFSFAKLASDFFHTLKNFRLLLFFKGQKAQYFRALGFEGLFENSDFMIFHFSWLHGT